MEVYMRKFFAVLMAVVTMVAGVACSDEGGINGGEDKSVFDIKIYEITAVGADVEIAPIDYEGGYYFDALNEESYNYFKIAGFQKFIDNEVSKRMVTYNISKSEALESMLSYSNDGFTFMTLYPDTKYYVVAMGVDEEGVLSTDVIVKSFNTNNVEQSKNTFDITIGEISYNGAAFDVKPSVARDKYFVDVWNKAIVDELGDKEFIKYCVDVYQSMGMMDMKCTMGAKSYSNTGEYQPGRDYYVVAFGFDDGYPTTGLTKKQFSTTGGEGAANCTFQMEVTNVRYDRATISVLPSDRYCVYATDLIRKDELEQLMAAESLTQQQALARVLSNLLDTVQSDLQITRAEATEVITFYGAAEDNTTGKHEYTRAYLKEQTEYIAWAVTVDTYGKPLSQFVVSEPFTTPKEVVSTAKATVSVKKYFDGAMLSSAGYPDSQAVVPITVEVSDNAAHWYVALYANDITDASRQTIISNLMRSGRQDVSPFVTTSVWNTEVTAVAIAVDADGNFGEPSFQVFTCRKADAAPASEFDEYNK